MEEGKEDGRVGRDEAMTEMRGVYQGRRKCLQALRYDFERGNMLGLEPTVGAVGQSIFRAYKYVIFAMVAVMGGCGLFMATVVTDSFLPLRSKSLYRKAKGGLRYETTKAFVYIFCRGSAPLLHRGSV
jgi:hypothetical protein